MNTTSETYMNTRQGHGLSGATTSDMNATTANFGGGINSPYIAFGEYQNRLLRSETLGTTWARVNISTAVGANNAISPNADLTAEWIAAGTTTDAHLKQTVTNSTTGKFTFSIYLKTNEASGLSEVSLRLNSTSDSATATMNITQHWRRYWVTTDFAGAHTVKEAAIVNGMNNISAWGAVLNQGENPMVYTTPTTSAALAYGKDGVMICTFYATSTITSASAILAGNYIRSTVSPGNTTVGGFQAYAGSSSATEIRQYSPALIMQATAWNTTATRVNTMAILTETLGENTTDTFPVMTFQDLYIGGIGNNTTLMTLNHDGNLTLPEGSENIQKGYLRVNNSLMAYPSGTSVAASIGDLAASSIASFERDGTLINSGGATTFNSMKYPIGAAYFGEDAPGYDWRTDSAIFADETPERYIRMSFVLPYDMREKEKIYPRLHYFDCDGNGINWEISYRNGGICADMSTWKTLRCTEICAYGSETEQHCICDFEAPDINAMSGELVQIVLTRLGEDACTEGARATVFELGYIQDMIGGHDIYTK